MTKWEYCEFRYQLALGFLSKKQADIIHFTKNGAVVEDLGQDADQAKVIAHLGSQGFEMVNCIHDVNQRGEVATVTYLFKRPISEG